MKIGDKVSTLDQPVEHLVACHRRIEERLETLLRAGASLETEREAALAAIAKSLEFLDSNGAWHTEDEEESFSPRLRRSLNPADLHYLHELEMQHDGAEAVLEELRSSVAAMVAGQGTVNHYRQLAARLREIYRAHIASEEEILFPLARQKFNRDDLDLIAVEMKARRNAVLCHAE